MTSIAEIIAARIRTESGFASIVPADWMQGRTAFGGLSAALALQAALDLEPDLPPLRSAQIAFIGPLAGKFTVSAVRLRRGRNAAFIQADVASEAGLGLRATFVFMTALESAIDHAVAPNAPDAPPASDNTVYVGPVGHFTGNFEFVNRKENAGSVEWRRWARLREREGLNPFVELMAIGDALPPAALRLFPTMAVPLSSLNWQINFLTSTPATQDGWWLLNTTSDLARQGYSSQRMGVWNAAGEPIAEASQAVAIFA